LPKKLILVRHGKSLYDEYIRTDSERHLAGRGYKEAEDAALHCKKQEVHPGLLVSSPAIRAFSTAMVFANEFGYPGDQILLKSAIYEAAVTQLLYVIRELDDRKETVILFGHNPGLTDLVNYLCGPVLYHLPTSGVAALNLQINRWSEVSEKCGIASFLYSGHKPF
jgi:phosphohistidine phosphatase